MTRVGKVLFLLGAMLLVIVAAPFVTTAKLTMISCLVGELLAASLLAWLIYKGDV